MTSPSLKYGYFGHHKCATTWVRFLVDNVCEYTGIKSETLHNESQFDSDLCGFVDANSIGFLSYTNAKAEHVDSLGKLPGFHVIRDPRDILVSAYFSHLNSHPTKNWGELSEYRERLQKLDTESGLLEELNFSQSVFDAMESWDYQQDHVLEMRFEDLATNPFEFALTAFDHLGLIDHRAFSVRAWCRDGKDVVARKFGITGMLPNRIPRRHLLTLVDDLSFKKLASGRKQGEEDQANHFRKGVSGDWRNHFTERIEREFKQRNPKLLQKLGYEQGDDWSRDRKS